MTAKQTPKPAKSARPRVKRRSAASPCSASPFSFAKWWRKTGRWMARNPEVTSRHLAAEAWRAGQQNKLVLPNRRERFMQGRLGQTEVCEFIKKMKESRCPECGDKVLFSRIKLLQDDEDDAEVWCADMGHWVGRLSECVVVKS